MMVSKIAEFLSVANADLPTIIALEFQTREMIWGNITPSWPFLKNNNTFVNGIEI